MTHPVLPSFPHHRSTLASLLLPLFACLGTATAQTTTVVPCAHDNTLYESATGALSNGAGTGLFVGVTGQPGLRRALLKFDVAASVPAGARVLSAELTINVAQSAFGGTVPVAMHRVLQAWGEGTSVAGGGGGGGAAATTGDATWLHTFYNTSFWSTPGGDFAPVASSSIDTPPFGLCSSVVTNALVADVQTWLDQPAQNHGWLLKTNEGLAFVSRKIDSRQSLGIRPSLSVTYLLPGQAAAFGQGCPVNGQPFTFAIGGAPVGGNTVQLVQGNGPANQLAANLIALDYAPIGAPVLPQCSLYLPLGGVLVTHGLLTLDPTGAGTTGFLVPTGFPGVSLVMQSAALDPSSPAGYVLSNAAIALLQ